MTQADSTAPARQHPNRTLLVLSLGAISFALGQTTLIPALTDIQKHFGASSSDVAWLITAYFLSASVSTPIAGRLGDMFGKRRMLSLSLGALALGSLVSALGGSLLVLIIGRAIQGFGGGVFPLSFGIVRDEFEPLKVPASIGLLGSTIGVGGGVGLPVGGLIADHASFHWVFWLGGAFSLLSLVTTELFVPESPVRSPGKVDVRGAIVLSIGLIIPLLAVSEANAWGWGSPRVLGMYAIGGAILWFFVELEKRTPEPLVNIKTLSRRVVAMTDAATFLVGFALFGSFILIPQIAQEPESTGYGFGLSATAAGLLLMPNALVNLVIGPISGRLGGARGARVPLIIGCLLAAVGLGALAALHATALEIVLFGTLYGIGVGFAYSAMPNLIIESVPQTETGEATGVNTIARNVGASLGSAVTGSVLASSAGASGAPADSGFTTALAIAAAVSLVATFMSLSIPRREPRDPVSSSRDEALAEAA